MQERQMKKLRMSSGSGRLAALGLWLSVQLLLVSDLQAEIVHPIDDWYDPSVPVFASDLILDTAMGSVFVTDQITGQIFQNPLGAGAASPIDSVGFSPTREEVLSLLARRADFDLLLEGDLKLERAEGRLAAYDGRKVFGAGQWFEVRPNTPADPIVPKPNAPKTVSDRQRDQSLLAEAVADLAGRGKRIRPWRWSSRHGTFQLIDQRGRAFLFLIETALFGQKRLRLISELDSLFSRLKDFADAEMEAVDSGALRLTLGQSRSTYVVADDPYTGDRVLEISSDTGAFPAPRPAAPSTKNKPNLPQNWSEYLQPPKLIAEGPAGQLISTKIRLTDQGRKSLLILAQGGRTRILPWDDEDIRPENVVILPEGFLVPEPPAWRAVGWTPEFNGVRQIGNSRFQKITPVSSVRPGAAGDGGAGDAETVAVTAGLFVLDAEASSIAFWPADEWPRPMTFTELHLFSEPLDLTVTRSGDVFVLARDADGILRVFRLSEIVEPILDLPANAQPEFLPGGIPTIISKTETRQTLWTMGGQPPALMKKETFDIGWLAGDGISWRYEPQNVILFSTDPTGESDTAITIQIEGVSRVKKAVRQTGAVWLLESDSGILRLDAGDPTVPEISVLDENGMGLQSSPAGPLYTLPTAGAAEVRQIGPNGRVLSLGLFKESWLALGADQNRLYFKDRSTGKFYTARTGSAFESEEAGQITGRIEFRYDDPSSVFLCAFGDEAYCMIVRPKAPSFLLGPMPYGAYRLDVSAGVFDLASPAVFSVTQAEVEMPEVKLTKSLDFIFRRAAALEESGNTELARFNYELYLSLYPTGRALDSARAALLKIHAADNRTDDMIDFYRKSPPETKWPPAALLLLLERMPKAADRLDVARKLLAMPAPDARSAQLLFFLYKHSLDPNIKSAAYGAGIPPVYRRFFESFDRNRL